MKSPTDALAEESLNAVHGSYNVAEQVSQTKPSLMDRLLTTAEVADFCRTVPGTVRYWRHAGKGPRGFRLGRRILYRESDVLAWIEASSTVSTP